MAKKASKATKTETMKERTRLVRAAQALPTIPNRLVSADAPASKAPRAFAHAQGVRIKGETAKRLRGQTTVVAHSDELGFQKPIAQQGEVTSAVERLEMAQNQTQNLVDKLVERLTEVLNGAQGEIENDDNPDDGMNTPLGKKLQHSIDAAHSVNLVLVNLLAQIDL